MTWGGYPRGVRKKTLARSSAEYFQKNRYPGHPDEVRTPGSQRRDLAKDLSLKTLDWLPGVLRSAQNDRGVGFLTVGFLREVEEAIEDVCTELDGLNGYALVNSVEHGDEVEIFGEL